MQSNLENQGIRYLLHKLYKKKLFAFRTSHKSKIDGSSVNVDGWSNITCK